MPTILDVSFGREFLEGPEPWRNKPENLRNKFAGRKFAGNSPKIRQTKLRHFPDVKHCKAKKSDIWPLLRDKLLSSSLQLDLVSLSFARNAWLKLLSLTVRKEACREA